MTLLAEDVLLLLIDDATGKMVLDRTRVDRVLAGAVLVELLMTERAAPAPAGGSIKPGRIVVLDPRPSGDAVLDEALERLSDKPLRPARAVEKLVKGLRAALLGRIVQAGFVREEHRSWLGVFPTTTWPAVRPEHEAGIRRSLRDVLLHGHGPEPRIATLIALLNAVDAVPKVVPAEDRRALVRRARTIAEGDPTALAVREAVDAVNAAVVVATTAAT
ncbi:MAG: hypothetical protein QG622_312 [Actinomycetota bacterium]|nr:hypothetical protein [Actinomycetota bacterium]